jgi:hypothetical protein
MNQDGNKPLDDAARLAAVAQSTKAIAEQYLKAMERGQDLPEAANSGDKPYMDRL